MTKKHEGCQCHLTGNAGQSLDELDFDRGIWSAAMNGEVDRVLALLRSSQNQDANIKDSAGYTALHYASRHGHRDICEILLDHGAHVNCRTASGLSTPLHRAAYCGHSDVASLLLKRGANPAICDCDARNCLHKAAEGGHENLVKTIIEHDADKSCNSKDSRGRCPVELLPERCNKFRTLFY